MADTVPTRFWRSAAVKLIALGVFGIVLLACLIARLSSPASLVPLPIPGRGLIGHVWLDDQTLLCFQAAQPRRVEALRVSLKSGNSAIVPGIGEALRGAGLTTGVIGPDVSRDAKWLLFGGPVGTNWHLLAVGTDGTAAQSSYLVKGSFGFCWLGETQRWLSLEQTRNGMEAAVHGIDSTQQWKFPTTLSPGVNPVGTTASGKILCAWQDRATNSMLALAEVNPTNLAVVGTPRRLKLPAPLEVNCATVQISRGGELLAGTATSVNRVIGPAMALFGLAPRVSTIIWISRTDGSRYREVGFVPSNAEVLDLHFTPDGQALTFLRRNETNGVTLWKVPLSRAPH
jgi:hypothetical protein